MVTRQLCYQLFFTKEEVTIEYQFGMMVIGYPAVVLSIFFYTKQEVTIDYQFDINSKNPVMVIGYLAVVVLSMVVESGDTFSLP